MRELLRNHEVDFHETDAGLLGIGTPAIWVHSPEQFDAARSLIARYQQERYTSARERYIQRQQSGEQARFFDLLRNNPIKVILYIIVAIGLILLMTGPFWF